MENNLENKDLINDTTGAPAPAISPTLDDNDGVLDLTSILTQPTQKRDETPAIADEVINEAPISNDVATFNTDKIETIKDTTATFAQATVVASYDSEKLADAIIDFSDTLLTNLAPFVYESFLTKDEKKGLKELAKNYRKAKANGEKYQVTEKDEEYLEIQTEVEEYEGLMPLSEAEKNSLHEPLKEMLKNVNFTSSPQNTLLMACAMIAVPRAIPLIPKAIKKYRSNG